MTAYRISADALLRLALIADAAPGANAGTILTLLREAEPVAVGNTDAPEVSPATQVESEADTAVHKIAKPE